MTYKIFDWDKCGYRESRKAWLNLNQANKITLEEFTKAMKEFGPRWSPSRCRNVYENLKKGFGFFMGKK